MKAGSDQLGLVGAELPHQKPQRAATHHSLSVLMMTLSGLEHSARALNATERDSASFKLSQSEHKIKLSTEISSEASVLYLTYPRLYRNRLSEQH